MEWPRLLRLLRSGSSGSTTGGSADERDERREREARDREQRWRVRGAFLALGITALGFALRLGTLRTYWIHPDEGVYYHVSHAPLETAQQMIAGNAHPPLYYYLLRSVAVATDEITALRIPALLFGTLSIFVMYRLAARLGGVVSGVSAAFLLAVSPAPIALSQLVRPYALELLLLISALVFAVRYLQERSPRSLGLYVVCMLVAGFVHYSSFLAMAAVGLVFAGAAAMGRLSRREVLGVVVAHVPLVLLGIAFYAFHIEPVLLDSQMHRDALEMSFGSQFTSEPGDLWRNFLSFSVYAAGTALAPVAVALFLFSLVACLFERRPLPVAMGVSALAVAIAATVTSIYPFGGTRHSIYLVPFLVLPVAVALGRTAMFGPRAAFATILVVAVLGVGRDPVSVAVGFPSEGFLPAREFDIPRSEFQKVLAPLSEVAASPGIVFMDLSTTYTLLPAMGDVVRDPGWQRQYGLRRLAWGDRTVVVVPAWHLAAGERGRASSLHLGRCIRRIREKDPDLARLLDIDVRLVTANGRYLQREIRGLAHSNSERRGIVAEVASTRHLSVFRLEVERYERLLRQLLPSVGAGATVEFGGPASPD